MSQQPPVHLLEVVEAQAFADPKSSEQVQIMVRTRTDWYHLLIPRASLRLVAKQIERLLRDEPLEPPADF